MQNEIHRSVDEEPQPPESENDAPLAELRRFEQHLLDVLTVLTFAIGLAFTMSMFLIVVDIRNGDGHALRAVVVGSAFGLAVLCATGLRYIYPALGSQKERMLGWLVISAVPILVGAFTGIAFWGQRLGIRFLGFRAPASWHELLAKGMSTGTVAALWALAGLTLHLPQFKAIRKRLRHSFGILASLFGMALILPAHIFPALLAIMLATIGIVVCCLWFLRKKIVLPLSRVTTVQCETASMDCRGGMSGIAIATQMNTDDSSLGTAIGIDSQDMVAMTDWLARSILSISQIATAEGTLQITLDPIVNECLYLIDKGTLLTLIRAELNSKLSNKVRLLAIDRVHSVEGEQDVKAVGPPTVGRASETVEFCCADFRLTCKLRSLSRSDNCGDRVRYTLYSFQLLNARTGEIVWESTIETKGLHKVDCAYR